MLAGVFQAVSRVLLSARWGGVFRVVSRVLLGARRGVPGSFQGVAKCSPGCSGKFPGCC